MQAITCSFSSGKDMDMINKMRETDLIQFETLCQMHLSFEFAFESVEEEYKNNISQKKNIWNKFSRKWSSVDNDNSPMLTNDMAERFKFLIEYLQKDFNIAQEGIFRKSGLVSRQNVLKESLAAKSSSINLENYTAHDVASVLKIMLSELNEPLYSMKYMDDFFKLAGYINLNYYCSYCNTLKYLQVRTMQ